MTKNLSRKRRLDGTLIFKDHDEFRPNMTPKQMFSAGIFGGTYFRDIQSSVTQKKYQNVWEEFPKSWFLGLDIDTEVASPVCNFKNVNKYGVHSGSSLKYWEERGWIKAQDPYGWVQWYCRYFLGRKSPDDARQIDRWQKIAGKEKGRWRKNLLNKKKQGKTSPVIQQLLLQWALDL